MKFFQQICAALAVGILLASCGGSAFEADMRALGAKTCQCFKPMVDFAEKVKKDSTAAAQLAEEWNRIQAESAGCKSAFQRDLQALREKYDAGNISESAAKKELSALSAGLREGGCGLIADGMDEPLGKFFK